MQTENQLHSYSMVIQHFLAKSYDQVEVKEPRKKKEDMKENRKREKGDR